MSLANGTATELKGTEAWLFNITAVPYDPAACAWVAVPAPGASHRAVCQKFSCGRVDCQGLCPSCCLELRAEQRFSMALLGITVDKVAGREQSGETG